MWLIQQLWSGLRAEDKDKEGKGREERREKERKKERERERERERELGKRKDTQYSKKIPFLMKNMQ